ncbi:S8 family serine peptidase [Deinococcus peraridilitoris]|uniref:Subtilisin-like serine protease n=1 Tax=Deinococcus peraridilitoris (strain DSM 19664 / LMG 22246 / CIP 109416 / KR-200) TaxID=937777 RepID=L0A1B6_DEIPD|nr:S8 family serine peptidase [Deinococcus peraridilitoris]AFZ67611.1 subtilisin-like serine protease [Deinococcus peraridilitoris DSM 19664]
MRDSLNPNTSSYRNVTCKAAFALLLLPLFAACGQQPGSESFRLDVASTISSPKKPNVARVKLLSTDTVESLEVLYNGKVIAFKPSQGFAIVTTSLTDSTEPAETAHLSAIEPDVGVVRLSGTGGAWSDGTGGAWSDGTGGAWSDGTGGAWSDGTGGAWSDGQFTALPANNDAWKAIRLESAQKAIPELGSGIMIAVIDSGVDTGHPALKNRLAPSSMWRDLVDNDNLPDEVGTPADPAFGHGTAVATIAAQISPRAQILPYRVIRPDGYGNLSDVVNAVVRAADQGAQVINLSLGTDRRSPALEAVIDYAESTGAIVVAASGNRNLSEIDLPARNATSSSQRLSVGSVGNTLARSPFSNYGAGLELHAPGEAIGAAAPGERLIAWTGTSMSTAVVSGAAALGLSSRATPVLVGNALTNTTVPLSGASSAAGAIDLAAFARTLGR